MVLRRNALQRQEKRLVLLSLTRLVLSGFVQSEIRPTGHSPQSLQDTFDLHKYIAITTNPSTTSNLNSVLTLLRVYIFKMDILRSTLQPLTQNLPPPIVNLGVSLLGESCYKVLLHDIDLSNSQCVKLGISKALGVAIITTASVVKVPQILKLLSSKSATGLSFLSYLLETTAYIISLAYNYRKGFAFSTYGETGLILVQNVVIAVLILNYSGQKGAAAAFVAWLAVTATSLFKEDVLDMETLGYLQAGAGVLGIASKLPAIATVWREGSTGQLSAFAVSSLMHCLRSFHSKDLGGTLASSADLLLAS